MSNDYGSKIHLISSKFLVEVDFGSSQSSFLGNIISPQISEIFQVKIFVTFFLNRNFSRMALCI